MNDGRLLTTSTPPPSSQNLFVDDGDVLFGKKNNLKNMWEKQ